MAPCPTCEGHGDVIESPCTGCSGHGRTVSERTVTVRIPSGVENGTRIQLRGEGETGEAGGPSGDLFVELAVTDHEMFDCAGDDLVTTVAVPMTSAALGATIPLDTFDGVQELDVRPGSQPGEEILLKGLGVTPLRRERRGDIRVVLDVDVPTSPSAMRSGTCCSSSRPSAVTRSRAAPRATARSRSSASACATSEPKGERLMPSTPPSFLILDDALTTAVKGDALALAGDEGRHAAKVARIGVGEQVLSPTPPVVRSSPR